MCAVLNGSNLVVPSHRMHTGVYVLVSTSYGQWSTSIKAVMADCSASWNETLAIYGSSLMFPRCLTSAIFHSTSTPVCLEIRASFENVMLGRGELVGRVETTFEELLMHDEQFGESSSFTTFCRPLTVAQKCRSRSSILGAHHPC
jgi:hypothetical protein